MRWQMASELSSAESAAFATLDSTLALPGEMIDESATNFLKKVRVGSKYYYLKRYYCAGKNLRRVLGFSRVYKEWRNMGWLADKGIPTLRRLVYGEARRWSGDYVGIIVTEEVHGAVDLATAYAYPSFDWQSKDVRFRLINCLADVVARMHGFTFIHNDLHWRNILVGPEADDVCMIDCPAGRPVYLLGNRRGFVRDLAMLDKSARGVLSRTDRLRFYLRYRGRRRLNSADKHEIRRITEFLRPRAETKHD